MQKIGLPEWSSAVAIGKMPKDALAAAGLLAMAVAGPRASAASPDMDPATGYRIQNYRSRLGYTDAHWCADGADGWSEAGHDLVSGQPKPVPVQALTR